ncbi:MAG: hypothetical protein GY778_25495 [bacterium]|nr:hypothetical protein [bacterium]
MSEECDRIGPLLSGLLDDELPQQDRQRIELHLDGCSACKATLAELVEMREEIGQLKSAQPTDGQWSRIMSVTAAKTSRGLGWFLGVVGAIILIGFAAWEFYVDDTVSALVKIGVCAAVVGAVLLLTSVILDRLAARKTDRYKDVEL